jgi:hypothetical protein
MGVHWRVRLALETFSRTKLASREELKESVMIIAITGIQKRKFGHG